MKPFAKCIQGLFFLLAFCFFHSLRAQEIAAFSISSGEKTVSRCPLGIPLDCAAPGVDYHTLELYETTGGKENPVPIQLEAGVTPTLWFILPEKSPDGTDRQFSLRSSGEQPEGDIKEGDQKEEGGLGLEQNNGRLRLTYMDKPILDYQYRTVYPPEGVSDLYKRSGFIHPLWSPEGEVLTRIQPPDHFHHYGIWGPWTKTHIKGRSVDFWNLGSGQGTVRFSGFVSQMSGPVYCGFKALQEHVDFGTKGEDQVAIRELLEVRAWNLGEGDVWLIDYTTVLNTPIDSGILLDAYRYGGGIGYRATEKWTSENSSILTSEGKGRLNADGSRARWCMVEGTSDTEKGRSGILFMGHPSNREFPEPMRVWEVNSNRGRGDVYFEFCPIRHNEWMLHKGSEYVLRYRLLVFDGKLSPEEAESYWQSFAHPPDLHWETPD